MSETRIAINGVDLVAPEWPTGNEPEYSRADLHHLDAILSGGSDRAAKRPAIIDLMAHAEAMVREAAIARMKRAGMAHVLADVAVEVSEDSREMIAAALADWSDDTGWEVVRTLNRFDLYPPTDDRAALSGASK